MIMSAFSKANFPSTSFDFEDSTRGEILKPLSNCLIFLPVQVLYPAEKENLLTSS